MKRNLYRAIKSLDRVQGYEPIGCDEYLKQLDFYMNNYSMELNEKILRIAKSTHTTIEMMKCEDSPQGMIALFKLYY